MSDVSGAIHDGGDGGGEEEDDGSAAAAAAAMEQELRRATQESICSASVKEAHGSQANMWAQECVNTKAKGLRPIHSQGGRKGSISQSEGQ